MEEVNNIDYDVLGYRVRLDTHKLDNSPSAEDVVELVRREAEAINKKKSGLDRGQLAVLVALKLASDKLIIDRDFQESVSRFELTAKGALEQIEKISPKTPPL